METELMWVTYGLCVLAFYWLLVAFDKVLNKLKALRAATDHLDAQVRLLRDALIDIDKIAGIRHKDTLIRIDALQAWRDAPTEAPCATCDNPAMKNDYLCQECREVDVSSV